MLESTAHSEVSLTLDHLPTRCVGNVAFYGTYPTVVSRCVLGHWGPCMPQLERSTAQLLMGPGFTDACFELRARLSVPRRDWLPL